MTSGSETVREAHRSDDRKADWLRQRVIGNKPANVGDGPHYSSDKAGQNHVGVNTRFVFHGGAVDQQVDCTGYKDTSEVSEHVVHAYTQTYARSELPPEILQCYCKIYICT